MSLSPAEASREMVVCHCGGFRDSRQLSTAVRLHSFAMIVSGGLSSMAITQVPRFQNREE